MTRTPPVIYVLHGDDEFAIAGYLDELENKFGDPGTAMMNTTKLDGRTCSLEQWFQPASALPFLAHRRLVVIAHPLECAGKKSEAHQKFLERLERVPPTTALVLVQAGPLTTPQERKKNRLNWLEKWAASAGERVLLKQFSLPRGRALAQRFQEQARKQGGELSLEAAETLAGLIGPNPRLAEQEIHKLLAFVNYRRPVQADDVQQLTADTAQGDVFALVDALAERKTTQAAGMLRRLLEQEDAIGVQGMIVRQFRLLLLARELLEGGARQDQLIRDLRVPPFVADKLAVQARRFTLEELEQVYHRLLALDEAVKTGKAPVELALEMFGAEFSAAEFSAAKIRAG